MESLRIFSPYPERKKGHSHFPVQDGGFSLSQSDLLFFAQESGGA